MTDNTNDSSTNISNEKVETEIQERHYAGFWIRVGASIIDTIILLVVTTPILMGIYGTEYLSMHNESQGVWDVLLSYVFPAVAVIVFWIYRSATPGKIMLELKIIDAVSGNPLSTKQCIGRYFAYYVSILPLFLGIIWVAFDKQKQGWHDKLAGTVVVKES